MIDFNRQLAYSGRPLPPGIRIMNPFRESAQALAVSEAFYRKYYQDNLPRLGIFGINPGRFGAGWTGIPFTDTKRLTAECGIGYEGKATHEPSSVFVYDAIRAYGGPERFYGKFHIHSLCPLGFTKLDDKGREKNYNYYDSGELADAVHPFIVDNIRKQIALGLYSGTCICLGTGKNEAYFRKLNDEHHFFKKIIALEHPRFIMQYRFKVRESYIDKYVSAFRAAEGGIS